MKLSVVILNYNVRYFLEQCLLSVEQALVGISSEIIVVDNASADDSAQMVAAQFPQVRYIQNVDNLGFSRGNNIGVAVAKGEYVCLLNPDTAVSEEVFEHCIQFAESNPNMGALGVQYIDGTGHFLPECKRNLPTPLRSLMKILGFTKGKNGYYAKHINKESLGKVDILAGAFMFMRKEVYLQVQGLDEDYFMYGEDIDLSYKLQKSGHPNFYNGLLKILHYKGESTQKDKAYYDRFYGAMNIFYGKHFGKNPILNAVVRMGVAATKALKTKNQHGERETERSSYDEVWVLTEDLQLLHLLSEKFDKPVKSIGLRILGEEVIENKLLVFDADFLSYKNIIDMMIRHKNGGNSFRIRPPKRTFIIGSDRSDEKGEVLSLIE